MPAFTPITQRAGLHYTSAFAKAAAGQAGSGIRGRPCQASGGTYTGDVRPSQSIEPPAPLAILLENHRAFLAYLERRLGDRALAEDILQDAFAKVLDRPESTPADEGVVPWFYRTL